MKNAIISIIVIGLALFGIYYLYQNYEKPSQETEIKIINANVVATFNGDKVEVPFKLKQVGNHYSESKNGTTDKYGFTQETIASNSSLLVYNYNDGIYERYYTTIYNDFVDGDYDSKMVNLRLEKPGNINILNDDFQINQDGTNLTLQLSCDRLVKNLHFCLDWSRNFIYFKSDYARIDVPERFTGYNKCFNIESNCSGNLNIETRYLVFDDLTEEDYVKFAIFDGEYIENKLETHDLIGMEDLFIDFNY